MGFKQVRAITRRTGILRLGHAPRINDVRTSPLYGDIRNLHRKAREWTLSIRCLTHRGEGSSGSALNTDPRTTVDSLEVQRVLSACLFCRRQDPGSNRIAAENGSCFARFDNFPSTPGHVEIVPKRHVESFFDLSPEEVQDSYSLIREMKKRLNATEQPDGYTIGINEGRAAGRSIDHVHIHLIPRHFGDVEDPRGGIRQVVPNCDPSEWQSIAR